MKFKTIYIWYSLPVVFIIAWLLAFYLPFLAYVRNQEKSIDLLKQEQKQVITTMNAVYQETKNQEKWRQSLVEFTTQAPLIEKMPDFIRDVAKSARNRGVMIDNVMSVHSTIDTEQKTHIINPVFELELKGGFLETGKFLEELSNRVAFRGIQKARISYDEKQYPLLTGKYTIEFKALKGKAFESK